VQRDVIDRLQRIPLTGYAQPTVVQLATEAGDRQAVDVMTVARTGQTTAGTRTTPVGEPSPARDPLPRRLTPAQEKAARDRDHGR